MRMGHGFLVAAMFSATAALGADPAPPATARLQAGTHFMVELQQHITSGRTPMGTPIYFRVVDDVLSAGQIVIRRGTVVRGQMEGVRERGAIAASGSLSFGVRYVTAVDGQNIRVTATAASTGRSRDGALIGWTIFWGLPGLFTKGVDAYTLRGARLDAEVLVDRTITLPSSAPIADNPSVASSVSALLKHRNAAGKTGPIELAIERSAALGNLFFRVNPSEFPADRPAVATVQLASVNGIPLPEQLAANGFANGEISFDAWSLLKYCDDGENHLAFLLGAPDGPTATLTYSLPVKLIRKVKK